MIVLSKISRTSLGGKHWVLADQLVVSGTSCLTLLLAARHMDAAGFGQLAFVMLVQLLVMTIQQALITGPYLVINAGRKERAVYLDTLFAGQVLLSLMLMLAVVVVCLAAPVAMQPYRAVAGWVCLLFMGAMFQELLRRIFIVEERASWAFGIDSVTGCLQLLILAAICLKGPLPLRDVLAVMGLTYVPSVMTGVWRIGFQVPPIAACRSSLAEHLKRGKWLLASALLQWWAGNAFSLAAGVMLGAVAFGALRLAQTAFGFLNLLLQAFESYVLPNAARYYRLSATSLYAYLRGVSVRAATVVIPLLTLAAVLAKPLFGLIGGVQYRGFYRLLWELCVLYLIIFVGYPIRMAVRAMELNRAFFLAYLLSSASSVLTAPALIRHWGVDGAIAGLALSQVLMIGYWQSILIKKKFYGDHSHRAR